MVSVRHPLLYVLYSNIIVITVVNVMKPSECSHVELSNSWASNLEAQLEQLSPAFKGKGACQRLSAPTHLFLFYCGAGAREGGGGYIQFLGAGSSFLLHCQQRALQGEPGRKAFTSANGFLE